MLPIFGGGNVLQNDLAMLLCCNGMGHHVDDLIDLAYDVHALFASVVFDAYIFLAPLLVCVSRRPMTSARLLSWTLEWLRTSSD